MAQHVPGGSITYFGLFTDAGRLAILAGHNNDLANFWDWYGDGGMPLKPSTDAFRLGTNAVLYHSLTDTRQGSRRKSRRSRRAVVRNVSRHPRPPLRPARRERRCKLAPSRNSRRVRSNTHRKPTTCKVRRAVGRTRRPAGRRHRGWLAPGHAPTSNSRPRGTWLRRRATRRSDTPSFWLRSLLSSHSASAQNNASALEVACRPRRNAFWPDGVGDETDAVPDPFGGSAPHP